MGKGTLFYPKTKVCFSMGNSERTAFKNVFCNYTALEIQKDLRGLQLKICLTRVYCKLMRLVVATISIQIRTQIGIQKLKSMSVFDFIFEFISKIVEFDQKSQK